MSRPGLLPSFSLLLAGEAGDGIPFLAQQLAQLLARRMPSLLLLADPPAEIRATAGSLGGVLSYQLRCGSSVYHCSECVNLLLALRPTALETLQIELAPDAIVLLHAERFAADQSLTRPRQGAVYPLPLTAWNRSALATRKLSQPETDRCESFFLLGLLAWMLELPLQPVQQWLHATFARKPEMAQATELALTSGHAQAESACLPRCGLPVTPAPAPGIYRLLRGSEALLLGLLTAAHHCPGALLLAAAPAPATAELLALAHEMACDRLVVLPCADEVAALGSALGAAYGGQMGVALCSGPGLSAMSELLGLAVMAQLPVVVIQVQHGGPALALPRHVEQADLATAVYGRTGAAPLVVLAQATARDGLEVVVEAVQLAQKERIPVIVLTDIHLLQLAETTRIPDPLLQGQHSSPLSEPPLAPEPANLRVGWLPNHPEVYRCLSGLERLPENGQVSFDPENHAQQCAARAARLQRLQAALPCLTIEGDAAGELLLIGWGGSFGPLREALLHLRARGHTVGHAHLRYLQPLPADLPQAVSRYRVVLVVELNDGQLANYLRSVLACPIYSHARMGGTMFRIAEILAAAEPYLTPRQEVST
ncbi:MAG: 2-oxoacid:acceptor oxidoreductase family protein [Gemmataceae bacterium]